MSTAHIDSVANITHSNCNQYILFKNLFLFRKILVAYATNVKITEILCKFVMKLEKINCFRFVNYFRG